MNEDRAPTAARADVSLEWVRRGVWASLSMGLVVLSFSFVGFGAFARDAGFPLWQVVFMSLAIWALPSALIFVSALAAGAGLAAAALAVALSAVRLLPMTIAVLPLLSATKAKRIWLVVAVHYVAVTAYVEAFLLLPKVPEEHRLAFFLGLGTSLMVIASGFGALGYLIAGALPQALALGLVILAPLYFLLSMLKAASHLSEYVALAAGLVLGPLAHSFNGEFDLLIGGVLAGLLGCGVERWRKVALR